MKVLFWGTPETAVPFLEFLHGRTPVSAVVTQPDAAVGRGLRVQPSPVKVFAAQRGIPILQPEKLKDPAAIEAIRGLKPDLGIVVAYGKLIPRAIIDLFPKGLFNVHFSLLPRLRGAAPMQRAILEGDAETGVTLFQITEALDAGDLLVQKSIPLAEGDDAISLEGKLVPLGLEALGEALDLVQRGAAILTPQKGTPTFAPMLSRDDARIDWTRPAAQISRQVRALIRLGAHTRLPSGKLIKILQCDAVPGAGGKNPGAVRAFERDKGFLVECGEGSLLVRRVQPEGKKPCDAWPFLQGARLKEGDRLN